jgi:hypothetical protein
VRRHFKRLFSWSDGATLAAFVGKPIDCAPFRWPQSFDSVHEDLWARRDRKFLVMINANKLPALYVQELYTERMRAVEFFSHTREIDLYGPGWAEPSHHLGRSMIPWTVRRLWKGVRKRWERIYPNQLLVAARRVYQGTAASKSETLSGYKFALCFENAKFNGWITEKIFDCFFAGTVPIYWGAPDITDYVPAECFIDMRKFRDYADLREHLKAIGPRELEHYRDNARAYLSSPRFHPFTRQAFAEAFGRIVAEDTGVAI